ECGVCRLGRLGCGWCRYRPWWPHPGVTPQTPQPLEVLATTPSDTPVRLGGSWSGTSCQDEYWSLYPVNVAQDTPDPSEWCLWYDMSIQRGGRPVPFRPTSVT